jgi:hypothetical protein
MKQTSGLSSYPVFPNWVFSGTLQISDEIVEKLITENHELDYVDFGSVTKVGKFTQNTLNLTRLIGTVFFDTMVSHFRLTGSQRNIESVDAQLYHVSPAKCVPHSISRHRWYRSVLYLDCDSKSSKIHLPMLDNKAYATPPGVQDYDHYIEPEKFKIVFWPAHLPWGLTYNHSRKDTVIFSNSFIIKAK